MNKHGLVIACDTCGGVVTNTGTVCDSCIQSMFGKIIPQAAQALTGSSPSMTSGHFGGLGGFGGRFDPDLQAKIDKALAGKVSQQDKVAEFLKKDLGIDPGALPMTAKQARLRLNEIMQARTAASLLFTGSSLGIKHVEFSPDPGSQRACTTCHNSDTYDQGSGGLWHCYDCDADFTPAPLPTEKPVTQNDKDSDWSDMMRAYSALHTDKMTSFRVNAQRGYGSRDEGCSAPEPVVFEIEPNPAFLSVGMTVRLRKNVLGPETFVYAKKGGLFDDHEIVELPSMKPIPDAYTNWIVVEVI